MQTFIQSNVHIQGQATFELDVQNAKPPVPKTVKMIEHDPDHFGKPIAENARGILLLNRQLSNQKVKKGIALALCVLTALVCSIVILGILGEHDEAIIVMQGFFVSGVVMLLPIAAFLHFTKSANTISTLIQKQQQILSSLERQNQQDTRVGDYIVCPYCEAASVYVPLNSPPPLDGLKHCLKCGKQFFTTRLDSYPVVFK